MDRGTFREIEHTADLGLDLTGPTPAAVLEAVQRGLVRALFGEDPTAVPDEERSVALSERDLPELLKAWCEAIYRLLEEERFVALETRVDSDRPDDFRARVRGTVLPPEEVARASELKAVTWHQLQFAAAADGGWEARVIFDV
ncbi:MAG TPA: archease [Gemmatimonadota bacterium]|nr:archease [Gemmatimonadota bacterium]